MFKAATRQDQDCVVHEKRTQTRSHCYSPHRKDSHLLSKTRMHLRRPEAWPHDETRIASETTVYGHLNMAPRTAKSCVVVNTTTVAGIASRLDIHAQQNNFGNSCLRERGFVYCKKTPRAPTKPNTRKPLGSSTRLLYIDT